MGRPIGIPVNNFCIQCGEDKGKRIWVCERCQVPSLSEIEPFPLGFWDYVERTKNRMWPNNAKR